MQIGRFQAAARAGKLVAICRHGRCWTSSAGAAFLPSLRRRSLVANARNPRLKTSSTSCRSAEDMSRVARRSGHGLAGEQARCRRVPQASLALSEARVSPPSYSTVGSACGYLAARGRRKPWRRRKRSPAGRQEDRRCPATGWRSCHSCCDRTYCCSEEAGQFLLRHAEMLSVPSAALSGAAIGRSRRLRTSRCRGFAKPSTTSSKAPPRRGSRGPPRYAHAACNSRG